MIPCAKDPVPIDSDKQLIDFDGVDLQFLQTSQTRVPCTKIIEMNAETGPAQLAHCFGDYRTANRISLGNFNG
jgi:hypothetical protein